MENLGGGHPTPSESALFKRCRRPAACVHAPRSSSRRTGPPGGRKLNAFAIFALTSAQVRALEDERRRTCATSAVGSSAITLDSTSVIALHINRLCTVN